MRQTIHLKRSITIITTIMIILLITPYTALAANEESQDSTSSTYKYAAGWLGAILSLAIAVYGLNKLVREKTVLRTQSRKEAEGHRG